MKVAYVIAAVVLALGCLAGYVLMSIFAPTAVNSYLGAVELIALPLIVGFGAYLTSQLQTIREQTNGTTSTLIRAMQEHTRMLAAAQVPTEAILAPPGPVQAPPEADSVPVQAAPSRPASGQDGASP